MGTTTKKRAKLTYLDKSEISIVVKCGECDYWHGFALDLIEAWTVAARHESTFHSGHTNALKRLHDARRRAERALDAEVTPDD